MAENLIVYTSTDSTSFNIDHIDGSHVARVALPISPTCVAVDQDAVVVGGSVDFAESSQLLLFDLAGVEKHRMAFDSEPRELAFSPSGRSLACGLLNGYICILSETAEGWHIDLEWQAAERGITSLLWLGEDVLLAGSFIGALSSWNSHDGSSYRALSELMLHGFAGSLIRILKDDIGSNVLCLTATSNDLEIVFSGHANGTVRKTNVLDGEFGQFTAHQLQVDGIAMCEDSNALITCGRDLSIISFSLQDYHALWRYTTVQAPSSLMLRSGVVYVGVTNLHVIGIAVETGSLIRQYSQAMQGWVKVAVSPIITGPFRCQFVE